mgnify:CR=1 FL=1
MNAKETVCQFGPDNSLVGILTMPEKQAEPSGPVVVLLSAGLLHRVGPFRLYISLARKLAKVGVTTLRFDLSGVGDSESSRSATSIEQRTLNDIRAAYDYLQTNFSVQQFVVGGLCSGADDAFRATLDDDRVVGSFQFDGMGYRTKRFYTGLMLNHYLPRLASTDKWKRLAGRINSAKNDEPSVVSKGGDEDLNRSMPSLAEAQAGLALMEKKGQKSLLVYTGGVSEYYNYSGQIYDSIPAARNYQGLSECYLPESDHTYMLRRDRDKVLSVLCDWYQSSWPATA